MLDDIGKGLADIRQGLMSWRIWLMLAWNDARRRYRRSGLGQFWLTLSMAMMIGGSAESRFRCFDFGRSESA